MSDIRVTVPPLEDLKEAFAKFDTEGAGAIPVHDLGALLRSVGVVELKEDELQALISEEMFDKNFDLPEFLALMVEIGHTLPAPGTEKKAAEGVQASRWRWRRLSDGRRAAARAGRHGRPWSVGGRRVSDHARGVQARRGDRRRRADQNRRGGPVLLDLVHGFRAHRACP